MRHRNGTPFRPTSFGREMWIGRRVWLELTDQRGTVLCVFEGVALVLLDAENGADRIERVEADRADLLLFSGEKPRESFDRRGYVRVQLGVGHPLANSGGWQYAHRLAMAAMLGRKPYRQESVGHLDRKPDANRAENLIRLDPVLLGRMMSRDQRRRETGRWDFGLVPPPAQVSLFETGGA